MLPVPILTLETIFKFLFIVPEDSKIICAEFLRLSTTIDNVVAAAIVPTTNLVVYVNKLDNELVMQFI